MRAAGWQAGFTLIEVLVASAIAITAIGVLLQLFGSGLERMHRAAARARLLLAERQIVAELAQINPATVATGSGVAEGLAYRWYAEPARPFVLIRDPAGILKRVVALYRLQVRVERPGHEPIHLNLMRIGWRNRS